MLFLDYDGTLTPIMDQPDAARLQPEHREILKALGCAQEVCTAIVSGRSLKELKMWVLIPGLIYVGSHGFELEGPKIRYTHPGAYDVRPKIRNLGRELQKVLGAVPGIVIEDKTYTLSVHYRMTPEEKVQEAEAIFLKTVNAHLSSGAVVMTHGKKVWEIRPPSTWNKGSMVLWLFARMMIHSSKKVLPVYIGDDQTDEDAFKALQHQGLGIKVTENPQEVTAATYTLNSPDEVFEFLRRLNALKGKKEQNLAGSGSKSKL